MKATWLTRLMSSVNSPLKHTVKNNGKPVSDGHLRRHKEGTAHKSVGEIIGTGVNIAKDAAKTVDEKVIKPTVQAVEETVEDVKNTVKKKEEVKTVAKRTKKKPLPKKPKADPPRRDPYIVEINNK
tara:strand:+ start:3308 stop:3685 length:378 start_codon:yes stop_codon:yes gene_type:complete